MKWMNSQVVFDDHSAMLTLSCKHGVGRRIFELMRQADPDSLESALREVIVECRPELAGCVIVYMGYAPDIHCWEMLVIHRELPARNLGDAAKRIPLEPA